jgi:hypothetical protein
MSDINRKPYKAPKGVKVSGIHISAGNPKPGPLSATGEPLAAVDCTEHANL